MTIFSSLIEAAQEAADELLNDADIGSRQYETGIKLQVALAPFLKETEPEIVEPTGQKAQP